MKTNEISKRPSDQGTQSLEDFLIKLEAGPSTFGWDALLVFDRGATNTLLSQEYIDRLVVKDEGFPTLPEGVVEAVRGIKYELKNFVFDKPRLSFENASILESKAKLKMFLVGGWQLEVHERSVGGERIRQVASLAVYNAANRSVLDMNINLRAVKGSVSEPGKVLLDLKDATDHAFSGGGTRFEQERLGLYLEQVLNSWNDHLTEFPLSEIVVDGTSPINPREFGLRTHAAPGAVVRSSQNYGEGAVVVFVAMNDNAKGTYPADDAAMTYMLPSAASPYTSNLLLSHKFMMQQLLTSGFGQIEWLRDRFKLIERVGGKYELVAVESSAGFTRDFDYYDGNTEGGAHPWQWTFKFSGLKVDLFSVSDKVVVNDRGFKLTWQTTTDTGILVYWAKTDTISAGTTRYISVRSEALLDAHYIFTVSTVNGTKVLKLEVKSFTADVDIVFDENEITLPDAKRKIDAFKQALNDQLRDEFRARIDILKDMTFEVDALRLNKLLFRGDNVVEPRDVSLPTDLTLLGNLAPKQTGLVISPLETIVAGGQRFEFNTTPVLSGITWTVENLKDETGETGEFKDPSVGVYTAPSDNALRMEGHRRLVVTATYGEQVAKALVSVVPSPVSVSPWVAQVNLGDDYALTAGTTDGTVLEWSEPELGDLKPDYSDSNLGGKKYTAPDSLPLPQEHEPLYYHGMRLVPITVRSAAGGAEATIDLLVLGVKNLNYWLESRINDDGSVHLSFYKKTRQDKVELHDSVEWTVLRGSGTIDPVTHVYTPAPDTIDRYLIITAFYDDDVSSDTFDCLILPMPLRDPVPAHQLQPSQP
ncbi:hypothetical protein ACI2KD_19880 [Pseudomonas monteilii]